MRIAYLVLAHDQPRHLARLVEALSWPGASIFVHVDAKSDIRAFAASRRDGVRFCGRRVPVYWGEYSQVEAILTLMRDAHAARPAHDWFVLLSGSDYPLRSNAYIHRFLAAHRGSEFINVVPMPCEAVGKPITRLTTHRPPSGQPVRHRLRRVRRRLLRALGVPPKGVRDYRRHLGDLQPYAGSTWWALDADACAHVLEFARRERRVMRFFREAVCPDEMVVQTILGNSPFRAWLRRNLTYSDWSGGGDSPACITESHVAHFERVDAVEADDGYGRGEVLFARKFRDESERLVGRIEACVRPRR